MFSDQMRMMLKKNQIAEVICQLRFPEILLIDSKAPADFQEAIRADYPQYSVRKEQPAPKVMAQNGSTSVQKQDPINNYGFISENGAWRVNLTSSFISLSCARYTSWEAFARMLDKPLAAFIQIYKPAYFSRIGLRYVNFISRKALDLEEVPFRELISPAYLGPLADSDVADTGAVKCSIDADVAIRGGCRAKIHAGPGMVKRNGQTDQEAKFIFDLDLFMNDKVPLNTSTAVLNTLHGQAWPIFRDAITDTLYDAMEPELIL